MEQTIGAKIREFRKARGMTQKELGRKIWNRRAYYTTV